MDDELDESPQQDPQPRKPARLRFQPRQIALLTGIWLILVGEVTVVTVLGGMLLAWLITVVFPLPAIDYAGPTPAQPGQVIGSVGPTTSGRMDPFAPRLLDAGLACMIGKGVRGQGVQDAMARNGAVYMVAIGGAGAAKAASIKNVEVIAYDELGCESVKRLTVENFSAIVSQDSVGGNLYTEGVAKYKKD